MFCRDISWLLGFVASTMAAVCFLNRDVCIRNIDSTIFGEFLYFCALANYTSRYSRNYNCSEYVPLPPSVVKGKHAFPKPQNDNFLIISTITNMGSGQETHLKTDPKTTLMTWQFFRTSFNSRICRKWSSGKPNLVRHGPLKLGLRKALCFDTGTCIITHLIIGKLKLLLAWEAEIGTCEETNISNIAIFIYNYIYKLCTYI